jgi:hypothetical protein
MIISRFILAKFQLKSVKGREFHLIFLITLNAQYKVLDKHREYVGI